jgi:predicted acylesterase/phospholipase RssA
VLRVCRLLLAALCLAGCASLDVRNPVPDAALAMRAEPFNMAGVRVWGDEVPRDAAAAVRKLAKGIPKFSAKRIEGRPVVEILALSGGGSDGAFGAGLLAGWSARGDRPEFEVVTGVSAGAVIAPFAFLGPAYDRQLHEIWTRYRTSQLVTAQILPGLLGGPALADTEPLRALIEAYVDRRMLQAIAAEYRRGRLLLVGTTNLDAERPVVWNMGAIAASNHPQALALFREVILASAAIPGIFPPVNIKVEVNGRVYDEMHVDGGTTREVFVTPLQVPFQAFDRLYDVPPVRKLYIVKNGKFHPEYKPVQEQAIPIAARAIRTLIKSQNRGEIYRIYRMARDAGADFNLAFIPDGFAANAKEAFDPQYQAALFSEGYRLAKSGKGWLKAPPDVPAEQ